MQDEIRTRLPTRKTRNAYDPFAVNAVPGVADPFLCVSRKIFFGRRIKGSATPDWLLQLVITSLYHIAQNGGGVKLWRIGNFKNLAGKTLANCNKLSLSSSIKTCHAKFKTTIVYFIITCGVKIVFAFAVSSVVRG